MKEWWLNLALREKQSVALGGLLLGIFIIYELIFASLFHSNAMLRDKIHKNRSLLVWMQDSDKRIQQLESHNTQGPAKTLSSLLSRVQTDLNQNPLQKNIAQLQQADSDSIEIRFQQTNFDNMLRWVITLCRQQQLTVTDMVITPGTAAGIVDATLKLKSG